MGTYSLSMYPLIEHSYAYIPEYVRARVAKLPTLTAFQDQADCLETDESFYYSSSKSEVEMLSRYLVFNDQPILFDAFGRESRSQAENELIAHSLTLLNDYIKLLKRLYSGSITENELNTHRILTEYFGGKFTQILRTNSDQNFLDSCLSLILTRLDVIYRIFFIEILVYCKSQLIENNSSLISRSGIIKNELSFFAGNDFYEVDNLCRHVNTLWSPIIKVPSSLPALKVSVFITSGSINDILCATTCISVIHIMTFLGMIGSRAFGVTSLLWEKSYCTYRNIPHHNIIVGWSSGASLALQLCAANPQKVKCLILLNFPTVTPLFEKKIIPSNILKAIRCPILFISGTESVVSKSDHIEGLRDKFRCPTGFVRVYHCDDMILMPLSKKLELNIPQDIVDIKIIEKMKDFIQHFYLGEPYPTNNNDSNNENLNNDI
ncbi:KAT8 regulatory NSL complex subunit 3 [Thelohanellus kitauei]|uniref:KAT8 regulatory NSL complex subunit 3 n=1 Tax=Thelohanellus kitauei TaxID=669202 RepID=A0A0C2N146_THEKT|nr:KAT8 regulatory NSL complex subunit 3 [Thelohanellus kitauei]